MLAQISPQQTPSSHHKILQFTHHVDPAGPILPRADRLRSAGRGIRGGPWAGSRAGGGATSKLPGSHNAGYGGGASRDCRSVTLESAPNMAATVVEATHHPNAGGGDPHADLQGLGVFLSHGRACCSLNLTHHFSCKARGGYSQCKNTVPVLKQKVRYRYSKTKIRYQY